MAKDSTNDDQLHDELLANAPLQAGDDMLFGDRDPAAMMADLEEAMAKLAAVVATMPEDFQQAFASVELPEEPSKD